MAVSRDQKGSARARSSAQLERQERAFALHLDGLTHREIAAAMGIDKKTVARDLAAEAERRADELHDRREAEAAIHLARLDRLYRRAEALERVPGSGALATCARVLELRAKVLGLDAATKVDVGMQGLLDALDAD
jgi:transposase